ncbi:aldehyde dehydrogenase [Sporothrix schenckii 1099-18]|uniref:Aldehyde dehydrogenase n=1 Tax=Sporothrix schenckii 1099-18 TaxID=1397361 RepID=A0A0F2LTT8_SPOSC|nr:aldehyde dehydrogenase [Sporothrix schenckii 1099-18]KJR80269.1 aldehyde dehydrogenase [Sporothrix schenckii 1099-18]
MAPATDTAKAGSKRRAPMSCDRCKSRKTKCVDPVPGPCQFCASISAVCHLDPSRRRQRPYYHVSEEEFRYMTKALEHFLPNVDLNLQSLREVVQALEAGQPIRGADYTYSGQTPMQSQTQTQGQTQRQAHAGLLTAPPSEGSASSGDSIVVGDDSRTTPASTVAAKTEDAAALDASIDEIDELHGELGWLRVDARGTYRHVGADSGYGFHAAVRSLGHRRGSEARSSGGVLGDKAAVGAKTDLVPPFTVPPPPLPPSTPDSVGVGGVSVSGGVPSPHAHLPVYNAAVHAFVPGAGAGSGGSRRMQIFLPRRDLCNRCVSRFFRDIQSVYWFWSAERFYAVLDRLYSGDPSSATPALLCSLYSILALTCESEAQQAQVSASSSTVPAAAGGGGGSGSGGTAGTAPPPPAARYLALAKGLVSALCDEADSDSVRALCLLALALQSSMFSNTAYIYIGAAARISLTLGLHLQRAIEPKGCLQRQVDLRLYSTLFLIDLDVALDEHTLGGGGGGGGVAAAAAAGGSGGRVHDLSEQILSPGSHMPLDYLTVSCSLAQIRRRLCKLLYDRQSSSSVSSSSTMPAVAASTPPATSASPSQLLPSSSSPSSASPSATAAAAPKPSLAAVRDVLASLRAWYAAIPPHLRDVARAASFHQRSVAVLHLRYWSATIFATRPFLLYSALHSASLAALPPAKRAAFEAFGATCLEAAQQSLAVVGVMQDAGLLSSLITLDTGCILEVLQVFLLGLARGDPSQAEHVRACLRILQGMEQIFWTGHAVLEVMAQLEENGLLNGDQHFSPQGETPTPGHFFLDIQQQQTNLISGVMEAYFSDMNDPFFSVYDDGTASMLGDQFPDTLHGGLQM